MTEADIRHLADDSAPISDGERLQAAAEIRRLRDLVERMRPLPVSDHMMAAADSMWQQAA